MDMSVEIHNSSLSDAANHDEPAKQAEERIEHTYVQCLNCQAQVILLARTIQTFCYRCAEPVTVLDKANMYYEARVK